MSHDHPFKVHDLKSWPPFFDAIQAREKKAEIRVDDRGGFSVGDLLLLREYLPTHEETAALLCTPDGADVVNEVDDEINRWTSGEAADAPIGRGEYTGRVQLTRVTWVLAGAFGLQEGYVLLCVEPVAIVEV